MINPLAVLRLYSLGLIGALAIGGAWGQERSAASLMTPAKQQELFGALDLSSDALKPVAEAVGQKDFAKAEHELAEYYRKRTSPEWKFGAAQNSNGKDPIAEEAAEGRVQGGDIGPLHTFADNKIDWNFNATANTPGVAFNYGWQAMLSRMTFWGNLGNAYRGGKDERYAQAWVKQLHSFVEQFPTAPDLTGSSWIKMDDGMEIVQPPAWGSLEMGIRMSYSWPTAFFSFLPSANFTDEDVALFLDSCMGQARYLERYPTALINNRVTMEMAGLYTVGAYFPEFKEAGRWRNTAVGILHRAEAAQFLPDGAEDELSTMYHNTSVNSFLDIVETARKVGRMNELPADYISTLEKAFDYDLYLMTPDRRFPEFNDGMSYHVAVQFKKALQYFPGRADYQWAAGDGQAGHQPAETSHAFSYAGFYVMRSGWEPDANYFVLRAGPLGASHAHQDKLNVILWPYGRELLYNGGGATYEESKWRDYSVQSYSKNTVVVDGKGQLRDRHNLATSQPKNPIDARWESTADHDFASGVYSDGYGSINARLATHTRRVLFVKPDLFVVADSLVPNDRGAHSYEARWNVLTTRTTEEPMTRAVTTADQNKPNMVIVPLQAEGLDVRCVTGQTEPELLGWSVRRATKSKPVPATTVVHTKRGGGAKSFLTLLLPLRAGSASPVGSVQATGADSAVVSFTDGRKLRVQADADPAGGMEVTETLAGGTPGRHVRIAGLIAR